MGVINIRKSMDPQVNEIVRRVFELTNYNVSVQHVGHYTSGTHHKYTQERKKIVFSKIHK